MELSYLEQSFGITFRRGKTLKKLLQCRMMEILLVVNTAITLASFSTEHGFQG
jgi:hypothetical protein